MMWEAAVIYMRSAGWTEIPTTDANHVFQFKDAVMTIFPNGNWRCVNPQGLTQAIRQGNVNNLEKFLQDFAAVNPL
jgi:hypothetical protein